MTTQRTRLRTECYRLMLAILLLAVSVSSVAAVQPPVPASLRAWSDWVLYGHEELQCPPLFNLAEQRICLWTGPVALNLKEDSLTFSVQVSSPIDNWLPLPWEDKSWPQEVRIDGNRVPVVAREGHPAIRITAGSHDLSGVLRWQKPPQSVLFPLIYARLSLDKTSAATARAYVDEHNRLWLKGVAEDVVTGADSLQIRVFRKLSDDEPKRMQVQVELDVSGKERETILGQLQLPGWELTRFQSPFPARLEADGSVRAQVKAGRWQLTAAFRQVNQSDQFALQPDPRRPWPEHEIWVIEDSPALRSITIEGEAVDPEQTGLPVQWKSFPAYRLGGTARLELNERSRGIMHSDANRFFQQSTAWLSFNGAGWIWEDQLSGRVQRDWRLEQSGDFELESVHLDGVPQQITRLSGEGQRGVEIRNGNLQMTALSTFPVEGAEPAGLRVPAGGWAANGVLGQADLTLHLPPGWVAVAALGADSSAGSWLDRWTLLDVFIGLLIVAAFWRLEGWLVAGASLLALAYGFHQPGAPVWLWLLLLIPVALVRAELPGIWGRLVSFWRWLSLLAVTVALLLYAIDQMRMALFPQLQQSVSIQHTSDDMFSMLEQAEPARMMASDSASKLSRSSAAPKPAPEPDWVRPDEPVPTGIAEPAWQGNTVQLNWQGGVAAGEHASLLVLNTTEHRLVRVFHVLMYLVMLVALIGSRQHDRSHPGNAGHDTAGPATAIAGTGDAAETESEGHPGSRRSYAPLMGALLLGLMTFSALAPPAQASDYPPQSMLDSLRDRLLQGPDCLPHCADLNAAEVVVDGYAMTLFLEVSVLDDVVFPLPARAGSWTPARIFVDGREQALLSAGSDAVAVVGSGSTKPQRIGDIAGNWLIRLAPGIHEIVLEGSVREYDRFNVHFPVLPKRFSSRIEDWVLSGTEGGQLVSQQLSFERVAVTERRADSRQTLFQESAPAFVEVHRHLELGLVWRVKTRVERVAPQRGAVSLQLPLLPGEHVTTAPASVSVSPDQSPPGASAAVSITLPDGQSALEWESRIDFAAQLQLLAPVTPSWAERWYVRVSPQWRMDYSGIDPVRMVQDGEWWPAWQPRPGDSVVLRLGRPSQVDGDLVTVESVQTQQTVSEKQVLLDTDIRLRSSRSQELNFALPPGSRLLEVSLDGKAIPHAAEGNEVSVVLGYGEQDLRVRWAQDPAAESWRVRSPQLSLPVSLANLSHSITLPRSVWPLWVSGPQVGPAVLYWGMLLVLLVIAVFLGRHQGNPLGIRSWLLLALGASLGWIQGLIVLAIWLYSLNYRRRLLAGRNKWIHRGYQAWLVLLTATVIGWLLASIPQGLIGAPVDYIEGNGSSNWDMHWYLDQSSGQLIEATVYLLPVWIYRMFVLLWLLWLAFAMLAWLGWGWRRFTAPVGGPSGFGTDAASDEPSDPVVREAAEANEQPDAVEPDARPGEEDAPERPGQ